jgi:heme-binding protein
MITGTRNIDSAAKFVRLLGSEGREEMNFSEWLKIPVSKREKLREETIEEIMEDGMPLPIYLLLHPGAELNDGQKEIIKKWAETKTDG